ncbi:hypothetical protein MKW92_037528 [Papaver armeniacum]|nr:hypothetical protein MKW92_037528 [Papaver armeniacum]
MQGFIEDGNMEGALKIKDKMAKVGCQFTNITINVLIHGLKQGQVEEALSFIQEMAEEGFRPDKLVEYLWK